ncbi:hypothetical protein Afil01_50560 [Actinorhabdospora filicis]|uniref:Uncharacterized protein n=1 Tax=Actinorhabdospora filicis TaxID=1785913 RepID=A0A9W6SNQ3_9ACTN|nr:hypothetical protein [Actinorhabdospora filicis]GLZ80249.1 hypothetical protein Afil01_50560 [Actinorhabdospora filicis]
MLLTAGPDTSIAQPTPGRVEQVLRSLVASGDDFAILATGDQHYVQTAVVPGQDVYFDLEYRDGSSDLHYVAADSRPIDEVVDVFLSYLRGDNTWRTRVEWKRVRQP